MAPPRNWTRLVPSGRRLRPARYSGTICATSSAAGWPCSRPRTSRRHLAAHNRLPRAPPAQSRSFSWYMLLVFSRERYRRWSGSSKYRCAGRRLLPAISEHVADRFRPAGASIRLGHSGHLRGGSRSRTTWLGHHRRRGGGCGPGFPLITGVGPCSRPPRFSAPGSFSPGLSSSAAALPHRGLAARGPWISEDLAGENGWG